MHSELFEQEAKRKKWSEMKAAVGRSVQNTKIGGTSMSLNDLLLNINSIGFDAVLCQADIKTAEDKNTYNGQGYYVPLTVDEFQIRFEVNPKYIWYTPSISMPCFYFNPDSLAAAPFHMELFLAEGQSQITEFGPENAYKAINIREQEVERHEYMGSILTLTDTMRLEYFKLLIDKKGNDIPGLYELFFAIYTHPDYGFSNIDRETMTAVFNSKTDKEKQKTKARLKALPDTITVYRGGNSASTVHNEAYSWTLDINTANFFAIRRGVGPAYIAIGKVEKEDVIEYLPDDRGEEEIIVAPEDVKVVDFIALKGSDTLEDVLPKVAPMYHKYRDLLDTLEFRHNSSVHGKEHSARVLLLCLIMSELLGLPSSERRTLAAAAIYHDTQRTHDGVEPAHGKAGREYYCESNKAPDPIVEFLCEYHCLPDEAGYTEIRNNRKLSKNREKSIRLFRIFKDADGLDRVRLGDIRQEMDLNQYRMPVAKELTLVARIILEQVKL